MNDESMLQHFCMKTFCCRERGENGHREVLEWDFEKFCHFPSITTSHLLVLHVPSKMVEWCFNIFLQKHFLMMRAKTMEFSFFVLMMHDVLNGPVCECEHNDDGMMLMLWDVCSETFCHWHSGKIGWKLDLESGFEIQRFLLVLLSFLHAWPGEVSSKICVIIDLIMKLKMKLFLNINSQFFHCFDHFTKCFFVWNAFFVPRKNQCDFSLWLSNLVVVLQTLLSQKLCCQTIPLSLGLLKFNFWSSRTFFKQITRILFNLCFLHMMLVVSQFPANLLHVMVSLEFKSSWNCHSHFQPLDI